MATNQPEDEPVTEDSPRFKRLKSVLRAVFFIVLLLAGSWLVYQLKWAIFP